MSWKIKFNYDTGDTFGHYPDHEGFLREASSHDAYEWDDDAVAREALYRLKKHYLWRDSLNTTYSDDLPQPDWWKPYGPSYSHEFYFNAIGNDGEELFFYAGTYLGYFETLNYAEVIQVGNPNRVDIRGY